MANSKCPRCHKPVLPAHVKDFVQREGGVECWHNQCRYDHQQEARGRRIAALEQGLRSVRPYFNDKSGEAIMIDALLLTGTD